MSTTTTTVTQSTASLRLRSEPPSDEQKNDGEPYRYAHLLPVFSGDQYPPLTPYEHTDPGARALSHPNPRAFLDNATSVVELTPALGNEVRGVNLVDLDSDGRDQLALEVSPITIRVPMVRQQ